MFGAVSKQVAEEMAVGVKKLSRTDYGLAITGIAGPTGGNAEKPVGLVYVALAMETETKCKELRFLGERNKIREQAAQAAMDFLRKDEYVIYTAHWDHLGISQPVNGERIYHGAVDNASGVAGLIEVARAFTRQPSPPERSIIFM